MDNGLTPDKYCCQLARNNFGNCKKYGFLATIILIVQNYRRFITTQAMDLEKILVIGVNQSLLLKEAAKKNVFFWDIFPKCGWVGWLIPKQGPNHSKPPQIAPKIAFFDPNFTFRFPKSHKNPGVGGG